MSLAFDNCHISITGQGEDTFNKAMSFFFSRETDTVLAYAVDPKKGMILYWFVPELTLAKANATEFTTHVNSLPAPATSGGSVIKLLPYTMNLKAAAQFAWNWLQTPDAGSIRGNAPDTDGDVGSAWRVYNEEWNKVDCYSEGLVAILPVWAIYGK